MRLIIAEGVLFVVLVTTGAALLCFVVVQSTPIGFRLCLGAVTMMCADHDQENPWLAGARAAVTQHHVHAGTIRDGQELPKPQR